MLILGFTIFFNGRKSITNRAFLILSWSAAFWSLVNYISYQIKANSGAIFFWRLELFFAVWFAFSLFYFLIVFPQQKGVSQKKGILMVFSASVFVSILTLTPLVFREVTAVNENGYVSKIKNGWGMALFGGLVAVLLLSGLYVFIKKTLKVARPNKKPFSLILIGMITSWSLIIVFNFLLPAFFDNPRFIPLGALFIFPLIAFTSYAIIKHGLLNIKVVTTEILTFILAVVTFSEIIFATELSQIIFRSSVFLLVLVFGILLIKGVRKEVEQREKIEILATELTLANDKLRELDKQKTEFLSIASHQLRAPLTAIKGYSSLLLEKSFGEISEKVRGAVDVIFQSSQKLVTVIEDFLNITRIELGKMKYEMAQVDLKQLVETAVKELHNQIAAKGLELRVNIPTGLDFKVNADAGKIAQVIGNLIDNATKYTKQGSITISLSKPLGTSKVRLEITDTGIGMTPGAHAQLFQKFTRATDAGKVNIIGTGLGLYVAKQIVEAHHGQIWAESPGPGKGSVFYVEI
mgnify:FL=1